MLANLWQHPFPKLIQPFLWHKVLVFPPLCEGLYCTLTAVPPHKKNEDWDVIAA